MSGFNSSSQSGLAVNVTRAAPLPEVRTESLNLICHVPDSALINVTQYAGVA